MLGRLKVATVQLQRCIQVIRRKVSCESIRQSQPRGELRAKQAGTKHPELRLCPAPRGGLDGELVSIAHQCHQLDDILRKHFCRGVQVFAQSALQFWPGTRRTPKAEINPARKQCIERAELFCDLKRGVVWQHDPARAYTNAARRIADMAQDDRRCAACDPFHGVMLCHPEPLVTVLLCRLCKLARSA